MTHTIPTATIRAFAALAAQCSLAVLLLLALMTTSASAQTTKPTDGSTPLGLQAGAPAGSYALSGFDNINLYNGSLNFRLPLLSIGGRGGASHTIVLPIERHWMVERYFDQASESYFHYPIPERVEEIKPGYGPGIMSVRYGGTGRVLCPQYPPPETPLYRYTVAVTRLSFTAPDGTEMEFRDQLTGGQVQSPGTTPCYGNPGFNRGKVFVSVDGSSATFISDLDIHDPVMVDTPPEDHNISGYMLLSDGTRYRIGGGHVSWIRDRNGNQVTFAYDINSRVTTVTDSLNRQVSIAYDVEEGGQYGTCDKITYKGFGGAQRVIRVSKTTLGNVLRAGYSLQTPATLFPGLQGSNYSNFNPTVVSAVWLPDGVRSYQFQYDSYGELARAQLPTGGAFEYDFTGGLSDGAASGVIYLSSGNPQIYRRVVERRLYPDGITMASRMTYSRPESEGGSTLGYVLTEQRDASGALLAKSQHYFHGAGGAPSLQQPPTTLTHWQHGKEYQTDVFHTNGTTILRRVVNTWEAGTPISSNPVGINPHIAESMTTLEPGGANQVSKQTFSYDQYNNQTDVYEYDYGAGAAGALLRRSHTDYLTTNAINGADYACDPASTCGTGASISNVIHIRSLPAQQQVFDAVGAEKARTNYEYDNYANDTSHAPLLARPLISGLDASFTTSYTTRGNPTRITNWILSTGTPLYSYSQYDVAGNVVKVIDARGYQTAFDYTDRFGSPDAEARLNSTPAELSAQSSYAFMTKVTNALGHTAYTQFDYYLGRAVDGEDANGIVSSGYYNDVLDRPTQVRRAIGTSAANQTSFNYDDANRVVTVSGDLTSYNDNALVSAILYDQMGRTVEGRQYEGGGNYIATKRDYDALGRAYRISNPYRPLQGQSTNWTTTQYDALGRTVAASTADSAQVTTSYYGNQTTVTDQAGKTRRSVTDALGRLTQVIEDPNGLGYQTTYSYDALGNLHTVAQGSQRRYFMYDSLSRLIRAKNPEQDANASLALADSVSGNSQWAAAYAYDNNGNLSARTDARGVSATYTYDAINRNTVVNYSDGTRIERGYDTVTNGLGRLYYSTHYVTTGANSQTVIESYDAMGRPRRERQYFYSNGSWGSGYATERTYNLAGGVTSQTYPSGRIVNYLYDAAGRTQSFTGNLGDGVTRTYAASISYDEWSGIAREQFGTDVPLYHKLHRNMRGQLYDIRLSTVNDEWNWNRGVIENYYSLVNFGHGTSGVDNNGNIYVQRHWIPTDDAMSGYNYMQQNYAYDALNRISFVGEYQNGYAPTGSQSYAYDRYGNRTISASSGAGINGQQFGVDTDTNRLGVPAGQSGVMQYDQNGNLVNDTYSGLGTRSYDAENRMTAAINTQSQASTYTYDADGRRVRRNSYNQEVWQVYGMDGELLAEYAANSAPSTPQKEYGYRNGELLVTATVPQRINVALSSNGAVASASSQYSTSYSPPKANNGDRRGGVNNSWCDAPPPNTFSDWIQIDFNGNKTIDEISVFTLQDNWSNPVEPTESMMFSLYGVTALEVQYWNGTTWVNISNGSVNNNYHVWKKFTFSAITTSKIRVQTNASADGSSQITEIEAWQATNSADLKWIVSDHLGTPRMIADRSGSLAGISRHDYLPFGEELFAGTGGRTTAQGYSSSDGVRQQFAKYERDVETGLDYAQARYYSSIQGRFTSLDPIMSSGRTSEPQTWNRYTYVDNNPLRYIDSDGRQKKNANDRLAKTFEKKAEGRIKYRETKDSPEQKFKGEVGTLRAKDGKTIIENVFRNTDKDKSFNTNCHGLTFTNGAVAIQNGEVDKVIKGEDFKMVGSLNMSNGAQTGAVQVGDVAIYRNADGEAVHSATVSGVKDGVVTELTGLSGTEMKAHSEPPKSHYPNTGIVSVEYYRREDDQRTEQERQKDVERIKQYEKK